ncbi:MAG: carbohydrate porin [Bacteroidales bacterium]
MRRWWIGFGLGLVLSPLSGQSGGEKWLGLETSVTGDFIKNLSGGLERGFAYIGMEELGLTLDLEAAGWWKGGEVFLHGLNSHGGLPSQDFIGDMQVASNIESGDYTGFYQYYLRQHLGRFSLLLGQHDLNSEFVGTEYGGTFINSSFGISPSIALNVPVSIYPMAALAFIATYEARNNTVLKLGVYDGDPGDPESNRYNLQPNIRREEGALIIGELEHTHRVNDLPESFRIGGYYHTNRFTDYRDTLQQAPGNYGMFGVTDLVLWSGFNHPHTYLGTFVQAGVAPASINQVDFYLGGGFHLNGVLPERYHDALGIGFAYAHMGNPYRALFPGLTAGELVLELTYKILVFDRYSIQPNLQYIRNPSARSDLGHALVSLIRFNVALEN